MISSIKNFVKQNILKNYWNSKEKFEYFKNSVYFPKGSVIFTRAVSDGIYEHENLQLIYPLVKPGTVVFDIGSNIGLMAIPILANTKCARLISVEASPNNLPYLKKTNSESSQKERWTIIDKAVSDKEGKITFQMAESKDGAYDSMNNTNRTSFVNSVEIDCTTIDKIWTEQGKPEVSFIKTDIEGADLLSLRGAVKCIETCKPAIIIEWDFRNFESFDLTNNDLLDFAKKVNYSIYATPNLVKISTLAELELHCKYTDGFILYPNH